VAISFNDIKEAYSLRNNLRTLFFRTNDRWAFLDGYRSIGILWVIVGHCFVSLQYLYGMEWWRETVENIPYYFQWLFNGDVAVDGFLVVSAFLMANLLMKQHQDTQKIKAIIFYLSRAMRLSPAYFIAIGVYLLIQPNALEEKSFFLNFLYLQNFESDYSKYFMYFSWSLAVEEQFYLFLPPLLMFVILKSQRPIHWFAGLFIFSLIIRTFVLLSDEILRTTPIKEIVFDNTLFGHYFVTIYDNLYTRYGAFICGIFAAYLYRYRSDSLEKFLTNKTANWLTYLSMGTILFLCLLPVLHKDFHMSYESNIIWQIFRRSFICIAVSWLLLCGLYPTKLAKRFNAFMSMRIFYPFGHLLYSMYLFHYIAVGFVMLNLNANILHFEIDIRDMLAGWMLIGIIASVFGTMVIAMISFLFIELPIMNLRPK
jgi:peptidoglycan/LPS O-acetylase OafA/YrhL